jgi:hypothetical protein
MSRRFQFSLGRLFLTMAFVTLLSSHVYTSWKLKQAREDVGRMATELGRLTITDASRLNVLALATYDDMTWRWRVHVPSTRKYAIFSATRKIPLTGDPPSRAGIQTILKPGDYILTVAARPDGLGAWKLTIAKPGTSIRTTIDKSDAAWLVDSPGFMTAQAGGDGTEAVDGDKPLVLLRLNCESNATAAAAPPAPGATTEGIMIWAIEQ